MLRQIEFLKKLADLCEEYDAKFSYTNMDDGIHLHIDEEEIVEFFDDAESFRQKAKELENGI